jgi:hypothetical protein
VAALAQAGQEKGNHSFPKYLHGDLPCSGAFDDFTVLANIQHQAKLCVLFKHWQSQGQHKFDCAWNKTLFCFLSLAFASS